MCKTTVIVRNDVRDRARRRATTIEAGVSKPARAPTWREMANRFGIVLPFVRRLPPSDTITNNRQKVASVATDCSRVYSQAGRKINFYKLLDRGLME
jgi:hypothetical protein